MAKGKFGRKRTFFWSKSFIIFGHWGEEKFGVFLIFLAILWKLHSMCPKELYELENDLSIGPGGWTKTFQSTGRNSSENLSKKQCLLRKNILEGLFWKKNHQKFRTTSEIFWTLREMFSSRLSKLRYPIPAEKFDDGYTSKKHLRHFRTLNEYDRDFCLNNFLSLRLSRLHSMCSKEHFELKNDLSILSGGWPKKI